LLTYQDSYSKFSISFFEKLKHLYDSIFRYNYFFILFFKKKQILVLYDIGLKRTVAVFMGNGACKFHYKQSIFCIDGWILKKHHGKRAKATIMKFMINFALHA